MSPLAIRIESQFGAFNKPHSTTGGLLTYRIPTKPSIVGMVGAMLGFSFSEANENLEGLKVGVKPLSATRTKTITYNSRFGGGQRGMINVRQEILIDPKYQVFLDFSQLERREKDLIADRAKSLLEKHSGGKLESSDSFLPTVSQLLKKSISHYDLYMGKNDFPLDMEYMDSRLRKLPRGTNADLETECVVPRQVCSDFRVKVTPQESSGEFSLNLSEPDSLKFYQLKDMPLGQKNSREHADFEDFIMKQLSEGVKLIVDLADGKTRYNYYLDENDKLVTTY